MAMRSSGPSGDPLAHLAEDGPRPVYALDGEERVLVDEALAALKDAAVPARARDFNLDVLSAKDASLARALDAAQTLPAFAPLRMVIVKDAERWTDPKKGEEDSKTDLAPLLRYLESPSPTTVLVLVASVTFDARTKVYKALDKAGATLRFAHPHERDMPRVVAQRAKKLGVTLAPAAIDAVVDAVGADVGAAIAALEKLALFAQGRTITRADVDELVSPVKEESVFALSDAVGARDIPRALELVHAMVGGEQAHPLQLLALLARQWRQLATLRSLLDARASSAEVDAAFKLPPFILNKLKDQARKQSLVALTHGLSAIAEADRRMKGLGRLDGHRVMERLVLELAGGVGR